MTDTLTDIESPKKADTPLKEKVQVKAEEVRAQVSTAVDQARSDLSDQAEELQKSLVKAGEKVRDVTREQPLLVVAGALAVGVALGMALGQRRD